MAGSGRDRALEILDVQEDQPVPVFSDRFHWIAAALLIVCRVELQLDVPRVGGVEPLHFIRTPLIVHAV